MGFLQFYTDRVKCLCSKRLLWASTTCSCILWLSVHFQASLVGGVHRVNNVYNVHLPIMLESERQAVYRERKKVQKCKKICAL